MTDAHDVLVRAGSSVSLHAVSHADSDALLALWRSSPQALEVWPRWSRDDIVNLIEEDGSGGWWIRVGAEPVGFVQHYAEQDPEYRHAGIDIFLVERAQGRGVGTDALRTLIRHLLVDLDHHRLIIDPAVDNERAIAVYEKVGFRRVGVMRRYELGADGTWHDNLLMDLLREDVLPVGAAAAQ